MSRRVALVTALVVVFGFTGIGTTTQSLASVPQWRRTVHFPNRYGINPPATPPQWWRVTPPVYS